MKKYLSLILSCIIFLTCIAGCANEVEKNGEDLNTKQKDNSQQIPTEENQDSEIDIKTKIVDSFRRDCQMAEVDKNGDIYYITYKDAALNKISHETEEITKLTTEDFPKYHYGYSLALHNEYIYYICGSALYRSYKDGTEQINLSPQNVFSAYLIVQDDNLYVSIYDNDKNKSDYYMADITNDPKELSFVPTDRKELLIYSDEVQKELLKYSEVIMPDHNPHMDHMDGSTEPRYPIYYLAASEKYIYYSIRNNGEDKSGRIDFGTKEIEKLEISPLNDFITVTDGWIYYNDEKGVTWRISESNLNEKEKLS